MITDNRMSSEDLIKLDATSVHAGDLLDNGSPSGEDAPYPMFLNNASIKSGSFSLFTDDNISDIIAIVLCQPSDDKVAELCCCQAPTICTLTLF